MSRAARSAVEAICRLANCEEFALGFQKSFDTVAGGRGVGFHWQPAPTHHERSPICDFLAQTAEKGVRSRFWHEARARRLPFAASE